VAAAAPAPVAARIVSGPYRVVMVASSYPRFEGDTVGTFMEPIVREVTARGHEVHLVLPWHPRFTRAAIEHGVHFHTYRYAPSEGLHVFGYAGALREDVRLRGSAVVMAPIAVAAGTLAARRIARRVGATMMHGHWVVPGGAMASWAAPELPLVISLHGSDVYLAEKQALSRRVAASVLARAGAVVACSDDLRQRAIALGAHPARCETVPYGVDATQFAPSAVSRTTMRAAAGLAETDQVVFAAGRFVRKKGFEYLIDAIARLSVSHPRLRLVLAGWGDLESEYHARIVGHGLADRVMLPGLVPHDKLAAWLAAADVIAVPSVRDDAGNVDGLPNVVLEGVASGTPVVATRAGGIPAVIDDEVTGLLVGERDVDGLARAIARPLGDVSLARRIGAAARARAVREGGWDHVARRIEAAYDRAAGAGRTHAGTLVHDDATRRQG
jgi:phosphatidyl-myo-inositol dimannoside synthase